MTTFITHNNAQSYDAGRFVKGARTKLTPRRKAERKVERIVFAMVVALSGMACWTAADTLPAVVTADLAPAKVLS